MRNKLLTLLLLSLTFLAHAAGDEQILAVQNDEHTSAELKQDVIALDNALLSDEAENLAQENEEEVIASASKLGSELSFNKAFDDLVKVMPQLGYGNNTFKQNEAAVANDFKPKDDLSSAIKKFAAMPRMRSSIVLIYDENGKQPLHSKNADVVTPIASITKLMTAMVLLDAKLPLDEEISISPVDINRQKRTRSRTRAGMSLTRGELLKLALMASDNLSAAALARTYPGGTEAALEQMNSKARELGMNSTRFADPTGLNSGNVSTANDLVKMVRAAQGYELIHQFTTSTSHTVELAGHRPMRFHNTNPLVRNTSWDIGLSKTGYISEAGRCLVMEARITEHPVIIVLLDSWGRNSRVGDANRVKQWMEKASRKTREL
jgi:D-alanyl-D-alanine endopeptidase (penicillin-binding protein 7)